MSFAEICLISLVVTLAIRFTVKGYKENKNGNKQVICYHCDSKNTISYSEQNNSFYCKFCGRVIDNSYLALFHKELYYSLKKKENE